ncbi:hypothetical protein RB614_01420 [Phytohabitans sp. ZYX-F-186]|uniref:DUF5709 domain-containing protein n=1 Tax=Phytohabitans maris TaxID=3071409 RepID=A0ABU0Z800_9ACTN|nr:hypothetical protein [Phytohabitans sp. ZYX-F-186]MDQ7903179.1 hypothetical protein [Phytohabitans sp. ZYX-F-186]
MSDETDGVWRDEEKLPLSELSRAMAMSPGDGQVDDESGNDAGMVQAEEEVQREVDGAEGDPDPHSTAGRALRPDFTGRSGPH